jgi:phosphatidylglycerophosphate synthase
VTNPTWRRLRDPQGVAVTSEASLIQAERWLVRHSGKRLDGIHSKFNRWLCRPAVRALAHTRVTPNIVTLTGLLFAVASAFYFARGTYLNALVGALFFYLSGLADEADGMLARLKFADSSFGCWFEGFADNASYLLLFFGVTLGLYARGSRQALFLGGLALLGCSISILVIALQRSKTTRPNHPNEYLGQVYRLLERDSDSFISRVTHQIHFVTKKGVLIDYVLLFTLLGWLPLMLWLVLVGSHLTWIMTLYLDHKFFKPNTHRTTYSEALGTVNEGRHQ